MKSGLVDSGGLSACESAFQRLLDGSPVVTEHVGLDLSRLTASIVSLEAGFDRGYLKKSRKTHLPLLAKIESVRTESGKGTSPNGRRIRQMESLLASLERELSMAHIQRDKVMAQNMKLWDRIRELEHSLTNTGGANVKQLRRPH
ncbi:hypothetical protein AX279_15550 [Pseudomonas sp. J237]|jgi:hypothetical protein|nr:hypothetical protein AX279_15550 [Pseudomonas sp. J237]